MKAIIFKINHSKQSFDKIKELLEELRAAHYQLGAIVSEPNDTSVLPALNNYFDIVVCAENNDNSSMASNPLLQYLKLSGVEKEEVLFVGHTMDDRQCAQQAGVRFGLALWECPSVKHIYADYYFNTPQEVSQSLYQLTNTPAVMPWLHWATELQFIAQAGMTYSKDPFDIERFERLREISAEIMSAKTGLTMEYVRSVFCNETGFQTPKLDTRAAIFEEDKILLVEENNGTWSLPGGWVDANQSIKSNTIKEVKEEAGLDVVATKLIAIHDRNKHNVPPYAYGVTKAFVLCEIIGGNFTTNTETRGSKYFGLDELPPLAEEKNSRSQIALCFKAYKNDRWEPVFD